MEQQAECAAAPLKTSGPQLKAMLEKTGRTLKDLSGVDKLDLLNFIVDQVKDKIEQRGTMALKFSDLNSLLEREGLPREATAKSAIQQLLQLRCQQLARLGSYSRGVDEADQNFNLALAVIPNEEVHDCFAFEDSPLVGNKDTGRSDGGSTVRQPLKSPAQEVRQSIPDKSVSASVASEKLASIEGGTNLREVIPLQGPQATDPVVGAKCDGRSNGRVFSRKDGQTDLEAAEPADLRCARLETTVAELRVSLNRAEARASRAEQRASVCDIAEARCKELEAQIARFQALFEKSEARAVLAEERLRVSESREGLAKVAEPRSAEPKARVAELQNCLDTAEARATLAEERAKAAELQVSLEKAQARAIVAEQRTDALEKRLAILDATAGANVSASSTKAELSGPSPRQQSTCRSSRFQGRQGSKERLAVLEPTASAKELAASSPRNQSTRRSSRQQGSKAQVARAGSPNQPRSSDGVQAAPAGSPPKFTPIRRSLSTKQAIPLRQTEAQTQPKTQAKPEGRPLFK